MKKIVSTLFTLISFILITSCSTEPVYESFESSWKLTEWTVNILIDLNNDAISSMNLLDEIDCINNETLVFDDHDVVVSNLTFNPEVKIALIDEATDEYNFNVECDTQGFISTASSYTKSDDKIFINNRLVKVGGNELIMIFENAVKIYNENFTEVLGYKDLTLIYHKVLI